MLSEPILVVAKLASVFDALGISYIVGGSVESSLYGIPRATQDVDLVADVRLSHVDGIASALADDFYVDAAMIREAVQRRASFNVVHLGTMFVDGAKLADLMIDHEVGVTLRPVRVPKLDSDYFEEDAS